MNTDQLKQSLESAAKAVAGDATVALAEVQAFISALVVDTETLLVAAAEATARGDDPAAWLTGVTAQVQAVALKTVNVSSRLEAATVQRLRDVAIGVLHAAVLVVV